LLQFAIAITAHFHPYTLQNLLKAGIAIPILHGWQLLSNQVAMLVNAIHIDLCHKLDLRRHGGVFISAVQT